MAGTITNVVLARTVDASNLTGLASEIATGTVLKAIYVEIWILAGAQQPGSFTVTVEKKVASTALMSFAQSATLNSYTNKKNILYTTQGVSPDANGNPVPVVRQWIKIPKGKQRFGLNDQVVLNLSANVENMTHCGLGIFKAYQ